MLMSRKNTETELLGIRLLIQTDLKHRWKFGPKTLQGMSVFLLHSGSHRAVTMQTPHLEGPAGNLTCSHCASYRQTFSYSFLGVAESYLV